MRIVEKTLPVALPWTPRSRWLPVGDGVFVDGPVMSFALVTDTHPPAGDRAQGKRTCRVDVRDGKATLAPGYGWLRKGHAISEEEVVLLHPASIEVVRRSDLGFVTALDIPGGPGRFRPLARLAPLSGKEVLVSRRGGPCWRVNVEQATVVRAGLPQIDMIVPGSRCALSFEEKIGRFLDEQGRIDGAPVKLPRAFSPVLWRDHVFAILGELRAPGDVAVFSAASMERIASRAIDPQPTLLAGVDALRRLVAIAGRAILWLDPESLEILERFEAPAPPLPVAIADEAVCFVSRTANGLTLTRLEWEA